MRDLRDPIAFGEYLLAIRKSNPTGHSFHELVDSAYLRTPDYSHDRLSGDPSRHHSKTPQTIGSLSDGGE